MRIAFFGSSLVSAYWNGAATYYRGIIRALAARGHRVAFFEPDAYGRQQHRDIADPDWAEVVVYAATEDGVQSVLKQARGADLVVKASGVGVFDSLLEAAVLELKTASNLVAFWDVDAPATLDRVHSDPADWFAPLIPQYDIVFTYGGGDPVVRAYEALGARSCVPIYNALDPETHHPVPRDPAFAGDLGFLGNRLPDRESRVEEFFLKPAANLPGMTFLLGGAGWGDKARPTNVKYFDHVYTRDHNAFNCTPRAVLNISRESMARYGFSPATRVFEAAGAAACIITDAWQGIEYFLEPGSEILVAHDGEEVASILSGLDAAGAREIGEAGRRRILAHHTYSHRAVEVEEVLGATRPQAFAVAATGRKPPAHDTVILGLAVTSSWGNGHATTYRSLIQGLASLGRRVLFLERDQPWYAGNRDTPEPPGATTVLYDSFDELTEKYEKEIRDAELVILGSFVPEGVRIGEWIHSVARGVTAFYDIDTPVTLAKLAAGEHEYISPELIRRFHLYLSFTGGPTLRFVESGYGSPMARVLYCSVDTTVYRPDPRPNRWDLGYLGTYSDDRQPVLEALMLEPARRMPEGRFAVVGPMYPESIRWPANVFREIHLSPREHPAFYGAQRFALNVTRAAMKLAGYSPSVRLFEAGACAAPVVSDWWEGLDSLFVPGREVLIAHGPEDTLRILRDISDAERASIGEAARSRVLAEHTPEHRAAQLLSYWKEVHDQISTHSPRRNRRGRKIDHGLAAGVAPERPGTATGTGSRGQAGNRSAPGDLHQPAGARR